MSNFPVRKKIRLPQHAYHQGHAAFLTLATFRKYPWFGIHPGLAETLVQIGTDLADKRAAVLFAWCIMPDHLHLLLEDHDLFVFVRDLKGKLTPFARRLEPGRTLWQHRFYDHVLRKEEALDDIALYIWENPVRNGIVACASDYALSGSLVWPHWRSFFKASPIKAPGPGIDQNGRG